jgi:hypothetical protein
MFRARGRVVEKIGIAVSGKSDRREFVAGGVRRVPLAMPRQVLLASLESGFVLRSLSPFTFIS